MKTDEQGVGLGSAFTLYADGAYYCKHCGTPEAQRHGYACVFNPDNIKVSDPEPLPSDGPEYHADHAAWLGRNYDYKKCCKHCDDHPSPQRDKHSVACYQCISKASPYSDYKISDIPLITELSGSTTYSNGTNVPIEPDMVNNPSHYTGPVPGIECIDVTRHFSLLRGTAIKYLWRADYKGNKRQDLEKARWYIQKELDTLED